MHILIVDNDALTLYKSKKFLEEKKHEVSVCQDLYEAVCMLSKNVYDFILCDAYLAEIWGLIISNPLSKYGNHPPLLFTASDKEIVPHINQQFNTHYDFLQKPVSLYELGDKLELAHFKNDGQAA